MNNPEHLREVAERVITTQEFDQWLMAAYDSGKLMFDGNKGFAPTLIIHARNGKDADQLIVAPIIGDFSDTTVKDTMLYGIGAKLYESLKPDQMQPVAIFSIFESYVGQNKDMAPSEDPNHFMALTISGRTLDGRGNIIMTPFERTDGKIVWPAKEVLTDKEISFSKWDAGRDNYFISKIYDGYLTRMMADNKDAPTVRQQGGVN